MYFRGGLVLQAPAVYFFASDWLWGENKVIMVPGSDSMVWSAVGVVIPLPLVLMVPCI